MSQTAPPIVRTRSLTKRFGSITAVEALDLDVIEGDLFGFLGPNGSGKTTTLRMLLGLVYPTSGSIEVLGNPIPRGAARALPEVGALVEGPGFYPHLSGRTNLALLDAAAPDGRSATRKRRITAALEHVGLGDVDRRPVRAYSSGMRQRLGLAAAILRPHRLLVLDEPTNGLDPHGMREIRELLASLAAAGTTVLLSSHLLSEVEMVCSRAAIVHEGRLVAQDRVERLLAPTGRVFVHTPVPDDAAAVVSEVRGVRIMRREKGMLILHLDGRRSEEMNARLNARGVPVSELVIERPTLEEIFLELTREGTYAGS